MCGLAWGPGLSTEGSSVAQGSVGPRVCNGGRGQWDSLWPEHQNRTPSTLEQKGWPRRKGASEAPGEEGKGVIKMFQDLSIELLDFAATLWPDFRKTG